jgi:hypothetical protein
MRISSCPCWTSPNAPTRTASVVKNASNAFVSPWLHALANSFDRLLSGPFAGASVRIDRGSVRFVVGAPIRVR